MGTTVLINPFLLSCLVDVWLQSCRNGAKFILSISRLSPSRLGEDKTVMINLRQESKNPISLENLFEVVVDDLQSPNDNLLSVNYFPSRYDPVRHAEKYLTPPAVCYGKHERCIIEKENNFKEHGDRYRSFTPDRQERFIGRLIDALSDPTITHAICSIWISY
ncbi:hypothetical protein Bca52824_017491 [Brassica carinata]|uniref:catalase n=1 Tax=Brassica carinata TaxID=52824 RepID=A0A8X7VMP3_BRACI|nr:hypothetical protein Bca52824_017491 [Brassica carinata]